MVLEKSVVTRVTSQHKYTLDPPVTSWIPKLCCHWMIHSVDNTHFGFNHNTAYDSSCGISYIRAIRIMNVHIFNLPKCILCTIISSVTTKILISANYFGKQLWSPAHSVKPKCFSGHFEIKVQSQEINSVGSYHAANWTLLSLDLERFSRIIFSNSRNSIGVIIPPKVGNRVAPEIPWKGYPTSGFTVPKTAKLREKVIINWSYTFWIWRVILLN